ncbi:MAG: TIGR04013 family B12-binding domain/radical SAM domain-containing protein [Candidatus Heimdallarchaeota archaeon]
MEAIIERADKPLEGKKLGIIFRYSRANIYSYHALIGALEINPNLSSIPIFIPRPDDFFNEINELRTKGGFSDLIIGLSIHTFQLEETQQIIRQLNDSSFRKKLTIICGGPHPSALPGDVLSVGADVVVIGEGEKTFPELIDLKIKGVPFDTNKGIAYLNYEKELIINPKNDPINLNKYPPFAPKHELYSALEITRGCKFGCKYCQTPSLFGKRVRHRSPKEIIKWGKFLLTKRDVWDFRFITPNAFGYGSKKSSEPNIEKIKELLSGLKKLEAKKRKRIYFGTFPSEVRPESVTEDTLSLTKEYCDNDNLTMGAQTGSPKILKLIRRGHTIDDVRNAVELANNFGFKLNIDFIMGYPEETEDDQYETLELCKEFISKGNKIHMHYLIPLPGTQYEKAKSNPIAPEILKTLRRWSNDGIIFGSWQHQYDLVNENQKN